MPHGQSCHFESSQRSDLSSLIPLTDSMGYWPSCPAKPWMTELEDSFWPLRLTAHLGYALVEGPTSVDRYERAPRHV